MTHHISQPLIGTARVALFLMIGVIAFCGMIAEPRDESQHWIEEFYATKAIAAAGFAILWKLSSRRSKSGKRLQAIDAACDKYEVVKPCHIGEEADDK